MSKFKINTQPDYMQEFKNFIGGFLGENEIDDDTLEVVCSSAEKLDSASKLSTTYGTVTENNHVGLRVKTNLFGISKYTNEKKTVLSSPEKSANYSNISYSPGHKVDICSNQELNGNKITLSPAIKNRPGKFFGSGGSLESLSANKTPKRRRSPQKLSKFSPFSKKACVRRSPQKLSKFSPLSKNACVNSSITQFFPVLKHNRNINNNASTSTINNSETTEKNITLESCISVASGLSERNDFVHTNSPKQSTPELTKGPFVDTYNNLILRILFEVYMNTEPLGCITKLLSFEDDRYVETFRNLSITAQQIYCRLLSRKFDWIRVSTMNYPTVTQDLVGVIEALKNCGLVTLDNTKEPLDCICNYLTVPELKSVCQSFNILNNGNKAEIIKRLATHSKQKKITSFLYNQEHENDNLVREKILSVLGQCVKLEEEPRKTIFHCLLFFSYSHYRGLERDRFQNQLNLVRAWTDNTAVFPEYKVFRSNVFPSREHFLEYEAALEFKSNLVDTMEDKKWDDSLMLVESVIDKYKAFVQNTERMCWVKELPDFLRRFTAGAVYVSSINKGIDVLRKYNDFIPKAEECLQMLLHQDMFSVHRRGQWFEKLALIYQMNYKDNDKAANAVFEGLKDKNKLDIVSHHVLSARASVLIGRKTNRLRDIFKDKLRSIIEPDLTEPFCVNIRKEVVPGNKPGHKKIYVEDSEDCKTFSSVEEVARSHFRENGYSQGRHDEGGTIKALVLICFWDIIYSEVDVEGGHGLFHSVLQNEPLDWNTEGFYLRRKKAIEDRLELLQHVSVNYLWSRIKNCFNENVGKESVIRWMYMESLHIVKGLMECLDIKSFVAIARLLITNYPTYSSGFPDLTLWNPHEKKCLFVEVKGPKDTLSTKQKLWLHNLKQFSVPSMVCYVNSVGCKSKK